METDTNQDILIVALTRIERAADSMEWGDNTLEHARKVIADIKKFAREAIELFEIPDEENR